MDTFRANRRHQKVSARTRGRGAGTVRLGDLMPNCPAPQKVVRATFVPLPGRELRQGNAIAPPLREDPDFGAHGIEVIQELLFQPGSSSPPFGVAPLEIFVRGTTQTSPEQTVSPL